MLLETLAALMKLLFNFSEKFQSMNLAMIKVMIGGKVIGWNTGWCLFGVFYGLF